MRRLLSHLTLTLTSSLPQEADDAATRQDKVLNDIERGVGDLRGLGDAMGAALDAQGVLAVAIDDKVDEASTNIKRSNKRMTGLVAQVMCAGGGEGGGGGGRR